MAAAAHAGSRLLSALQRLSTELQSTPPGAQRVRRYVEKREAAVEALVHHAEFILSHFAFIDGERIDTADGRLLEVFYADPLECVAARYCWALLGGGQQATTLPGIIMATRAEYEAFVQMQASEGVQPRYPKLASMQEAEHGYRRRADRAGYLLSAVRRLLVVQRHLTGTAAQATRMLEAEVVDALEAAEETASTLREVRRACFARRGG